MLAAGEGGAAEPERARAERSKVEADRVGRPGVVARKLGVKAVGSACSARAAK